MFLILLTHFVLNNNIFNQNYRDFSSCYLRHTGMLSMLDDEYNNYLQIKVVNKPQQPADVLIIILIKIAME